MTAPRLVPISALDMNEPCGGNLRRLFPRRELLHLDPFARFEELFVQPPAGLPPHEHRGFEAVTLVLEGALVHHESRLGPAVARAGDVLRLTAGRGCLHAEHPADPGQTHALQLWVALCRADKELPPEVQLLGAGQVPETASKGLVRRLVLGPGSRITLRTQAAWIDLAFTGGKIQHRETVPTGHRGFLYVTHGEVVTEDHRLRPGDALLFEGVPSVTVEGRTGARCALVHGRPHGEPIRAWGTVVD